MMDVLRDDIVATSLIRRFQTHMTLTWYMTSIGHNAGKYV
jgi:hypothetical protein